MGVENDLVLVSVLKPTWFLCRGIEINLNLQWGSKLTWLQWWGRTLLDFCVRDRTWLGFSAGIEIDLFWCGGSSWLCAGRNWLVFVWWSIDLVLCRWSKLTWFLDAGRNSFGFSVSIEIHLAFVWVVDVDFISVWGSIHYKRKIEVRASNPSQRSLSSSLLCPS